MKNESNYYVHPSSYIDFPCSIGNGTKIWHFCHIMAHVSIGQNCTIGQNVMIGSYVTIGSNIKIQNNVSVYTGVTLEDDVFCGPSCVFTNVKNPRSQLNRRNQYESTIVRRGATIGANATILCGGSIGRYAFIGAGAVVQDTIPDYALYVGVPAVQKGWYSRHGCMLSIPDLQGIMVCSISGWRYKKDKSGDVYCLDWPEDQPLL